MKHSDYLIIILLILITSCSNNVKNKKKSDKSNTTSEKKEIRYIQSIKLNSHIKDSVFSFGKEIDFIVTPHKNTASIDSMQFLIDNKLITTIKKEPWRNSWIPTIERMGKRKLRILAFHSDGTVGVVNTYFNLKSDYAPKKYRVKIINTYPHDGKAYTQGLLFYKGYLYESTGQYGASSLRKIKLNNGEVLFNMNLEQKYFGEGITLSNGKLLQLTWTSGKAFVYDIENFNREDIFYPQTSNGQGWGITTTDDNELVISDGSNLLSVLDPVSFSRKRIIEVYDNKGKVNNLNELEFIDGKIYANVWFTDIIVIIDPKSGRVTGSIDLAKLLSPAEKSRLNKSDDVLNGIAWDNDKRRLFVTGKNWPKLFEISLLE